MSAARQKNGVLYDGRDRVLARFVRDDRLDQDGGHVFDAMVVLVDCDAGDGAITRPR